ncbi:MAG: hypothetical protein ACE5GB_02540 [Acidimicrobiales bacterium]
MSTRPSSSYASTVNEVLERLTEANKAVVDSIDQVSRVINDPDGTTDQLTRALADTCTASLRVGARLMLAPGEMLAATSLLGTTDPNDEPPPRT